MVIQVNLPIVESERNWTSAINGYGVGESSSESMSVSQCREIGKEGGWTAVLGKFCLWFGGDGQADDWANKAGPRLAGKGCFGTSRIWVPNHRPQSLKLFITGVRAGLDFESTSGCNLGLGSVVSDTAIDSVGVTLEGFLPFVLSKAN